MRSRVDEERAFRECFEANYEAVLRYCLRRHPEVADDVVAETFLVAWRRLDQVPDQALPWLLGVARKVCANQRRSEGRSRALIERLAEEARTGPQHSVGASGGISADLAQVLRRLSHRELEALLLVAWEGLTPAQAAAVVGCSAASLRVRLLRARRKLATRPRPAPDHLVSKEA